LVNRRLLLFCLISLGAVLTSPEGIVQGDNGSNVTRYGVHFFSSSGSVLKAWEPQQGLGPGKDVGFHSVEQTTRPPAQAIAPAQIPTSTPTSEPSTPEPSPTASPTNTAVPPTAVPTRTPAPPTATATSPPAPTSTGSSVKDSFIAGWYAGGGTDAQLPKALAVVQCESTWNVYAVGPLGHRGLGQWDSTWWSFGGGDIWSPWQQGHNMAVRVNKEGWRAWECASKV
jgi:hypothetical protein